MQGGHLCLQKEQTLIQEQTMRGRTHREDLHFHQITMMVETGRQLIMETALAQIEEMRHQKVVKRENNNTKTL